MTNLRTRYGGQDQTPLAKDRDAKGAKTVVDDGKSAKKVPVTSMTKCTEILTASKPQENKEILIIERCFCGYQTSSS